MPEDEATEGERALSPVVSVVLVAAVAIILAATTGAVVFLFTDSTGDESPPVGRFGFELQENTKFASGVDGNLTITYEGGDAIDPDNVRLVFAEEPKNLRDGFVAVESKAPKTDDTLANITGVSNDFDDTIEAGDRVTIPFEGDNRLDLVWESDDGESSTVLASFEPERSFKPEVTVDVADTTPGATTTHTWTLTNLDYGEFGKKTYGFADDGDQLRSVVISYPPGSSFGNGTANIGESDINFSMTQTESTGLVNETDINFVNSESKYNGGYEVGFELTSASFTDVAGPITINISGITNPATGGEVTFRLDGEAGPKTVTGSLPGGTDAVADPQTAGETAVHTWVLDDLNFSSLPDNDVDTISVDYPASASLDGLDESNITVAMKEQEDIAGEERPLGNNIGVNNDDYSGSDATFDLSGFDDPRLTGPVALTIDGIENPDAGTHEVEFTFAFDGGAPDETITREFTTE
jgi:FlaG/FlaF family flagellin (archaellin)